MAGIRAWAVFTKYLALTFDSTTLSFKQDELAPLLVTVH